MKRLQIVAAAAAVLLGTASLPVSAEDIMAFRMETDRAGVTADALADGDVILRGALYIENYTGISTMRLQLKCDAPLSLENGDFTRDPSRTVIENGVEKNKQAFFVAYDTAEYMQYSEITGADNVVLWYAKDVEYGEVGELDLAESSFVDFDIRIPQDTPVGDYTVYISEEVIENSVGQLERDFDATCRGTRLTAGTDVSLLPATVAVYTRGDFNCDGSIGADDAQRVLRYCLESVVVNRDLTDEEFEALADTPYHAAALQAADASGDGIVQIADAQLILRYYLETLSGNQPVWE